jgi:hypothetical protein
MPRVRYGPDITDDAQSLLLDQSRVKRKLEKASSDKARAALLKERDLINRAIKDLFGSRANARKLASESVARQGYLSSEDIASLGVKRAKKIKGKGQLGLASTPGRGSQQIGIKQGYRARPETQNPDLYVSATKKAKSSEVLRQVKSQKNAAKKARSKAKKAAKKKSPAKKAAQKRTR